MSNLTLDDWIDLLNKDYFFLIEDGHCICRIIKDDAIRNLRRLEEVSLAAFRATWDIHTIPVKIKKSKKTKEGLREFEEDGELPIGSAWIASKKRLTMMRKVFVDPDKCKKDEYNLFNGFAFLANSSGDCSLYYTHIFENICDKNQEYYDYILNWMARGVQYPSLIGKVAIVLLGDEGVGKGTFATFYGMIFGAHFYSTSSNDALLGRFRGHLRHAAVVFSDEAIYAGNNADDGRLKQIISEERIDFEGKHETAAMGDNHISMIIATNNARAVKASTNSRRFFVLDVKPYRMQQSEYFSAIKLQMFSGGFGRLLYDLKSRDISKFEPNKFPKTDALAKQKFLSLEGNDAWIYEILALGQVFPGLEWSEPVPCSVLHKHSYLQHQAVRKIYRADDSIRLSKYLNELFDMTRDKNRRAFEKKPNIYFKNNKLMEDDSGSVPVYQFPTLQECRKTFKDKFPFIGFDDYPIVANENIVDEFGNVLTKF